MDITRTDLIRPPDNISLEPEDSANAVRRQSFTRSTDVWFDDGTLIIEADDMYFRVYKGILSTNSPVFEDMLSIPQPIGEGAVVYEGCPVVKLYDSSTDVMHFLKALHFSRCVFHYLLLGFYL
jgi:hypothetical protein